MNVRANADIPRDAIQARAFGAEGIGLCRTEHMFFAEDHIPHMRAMILADNEKDRRAALKKLLPLQRNDFIGVFRAMDGFPVTIRTLDPPLHEFLPQPRRADGEHRHALDHGREGEERTRHEIQRLRRQSGGDLKKLLPHLLARVEQLHEFNPMLGHRGCRLGITYPEITEMQARAIFEAAVEVAKEGVKVLPEVMIPLTATLKEMANQADIVRRVAEEVFAEKERKVEYLVGTMIELPRAALVADEIAKEAEFFSFGTNDLTQTTFGFSRDDVNKILPDVSCRGNPQAGSVCRARSRGRRTVGEDGHREGPQDAPEPQSRHLRRTRRRAIVGRVLLPDRPELRFLLAVPRADRPAGRSAGRRQREAEHRRRKNEVETAECKQNPAVVLRRLGFLFSEGGAVLRRVRPQKKHGRDVASRLCFSRAVLLSLLRQSGDQASAIGAAPTSREVVARHSRVAIIAAGDVVERGGISRLRPSG